MVIMAKTTNKTTAAKTATEGMDHSQHLKRLSRVRGQVDGIGKMIEEHRYCTDIINQIRAARAALQSLENLVLESHIEGCVKTAVQSKNSEAISEKIDEIMGLIRK
jgi:DNA-binding FrmR family transcriptional regulator